MGAALSNRQYFIIFILLDCAFTSGNDLYFERGTTIILPCGLRTLTTYPIRWYKGASGILSIGTTINHNLPDELKNRLLIVGDHDNGEYNLQMSNFQENDTGEYRCRLNVNGTVVLEEITNIFIKVQLTTPSIVPTGPVQISAINELQFECTGRSLPLPTIAWFLDSTQIKETSNWTLSDTVTSVYNYTAVKQDNGKSIHCEAESDGLKFLSGNATLNVTYGPEVLDLKPPYESLVMKAGERLESVNCSASCNPLCQFNWTKNGMWLVKGNTLPSTSKLEKNDQGTYECKAWNSFGVNTINFTLTVNYGPENIQLLPDNSTYILQEMSLLPDIRCSSDCRPGCTVYWIGPSGGLDQSNTLSIKSINRTQAGIYRCLVNNTVSALMSKNISINVTYGPGTSTTLDPPKTSVIKNKGDQLEPVRCKAICNPPCEYEWYINNTLIVHSDVLNISSVEKSDHGTYKCRAWNVINMDDISFKLEVQYGPEITELFPDNTTYVLQEMSSLPGVTCSSDCRPDCTVYWIGPSGEVNQLDTLSIPRINRTQSGIYRCHANNTVSTLMSKNISIIVTYGPGISTTLDPLITSVIKNKGDQLEPVRCKAICNPPCEYTWYKNNSMITQSDLLSIASVQKSDHGTFKCRAWNAINGNDISFKLEVQYGPESVQLIPDNSTYVLQEMSSLPGVTCSSDCRPNCTVYWIGPNGGVDKSDTLSIPRINRTQAGIYRCYANNTVGNDAANNLSVIVTYGASVISLDTNNKTYTVNETKEVQLTCTVDGIPKPKIVWMLNGEPIAEQENKTSYAFIAECEKTGNYTCSADNHISEGNRTKELHVKCLPRLLAEMEQRINLKLGENLEIIAAFIAYPKPDVKWSFNNKTLESNTTFGIFKHYSYYYRSALKKEDFGTYLLSMSNSMGPSWIEYSVHLKGESETDTHSSSIVGIAAGGGSAAAAIAVGLVLLIVMIVRRRLISKQNGHDKKPFKSVETEDDDEGLQDNPLYVSSGSVSQTMSTTKKGLMVKKEKRGKENKEIELGGVYENSEDFFKKEQQIYANDKRDDQQIKYIPKKNKDGLIYADLDLAPLPDERRYIIRGLENKSNYADIDLSQKAEPLPSSDEDEEGVDKTT